ncbi:MAG: hypothetical protein Tsb0019_02670 [Roseibium sp.]
MSTSKPTQIARFVNVRAPQALKDATNKRTPHVIAPAGVVSTLENTVRENNAVTRSELLEQAKKLLTDTAGKILETRLLDTIRSALVEASGKTGPVKAVVEGALGSPLEAVLKSDTFQAQHSATWDRFYAQTLLGEDNRETADLLKAAAALQDLAGQEEDAPAGNWADILDRQIVVPTEIFRAPEPREANVPASTTSLLDRVSSLYEEMETLNTLEEKVRVNDRRYYVVGAGAQSPIEVVETGDAAYPQVAQSEAIDEPSALPAQTVRTLMIEPENWLRRELAGDGDDAIFTEAETGLLRRFEPAVLELSERDVVDRMRADLYRRTAKTLYDPKHALPDEVAGAPQAMALMSQMGIPGYQVQTAKPKKGYAPLERVHALGIGDLVVIEEQPIRYELGEIAHIENVMATENRKRTHVRVSETETTTSEENEEIRSDEKSLETTDRFELTKETEKQLQTSLEITAGASVTSGFGPVSVSANFGLSSSRSTSASTRTASRLAREAVEKAVSKVTRKVREERVQRELRRIEETNSHGFENDTANDLTGIYRWLDKYYKVRAVNYGRRLMLELIVPEPANGLVYAQNMHKDEDIVAPPPPPITFGPEQISRQNYLDFAKIYGAIDIPAPPPQVVYRTMTFGKAGDGSVQYFAESGQTIEIPDGYATTNVWKSSLLTYRDSYSSHYLAGSKVLPSSSSVLTGVTGTLQLSAKVDGISFHTGWKVRCELTEQAEETWRISAWASIKEAYASAVAAYEETVAAHAIGQGVHVQGMNPGQNKEMIRNELKRCAVKYLSEDMAEVTVAGRVRRNEVFNAADSTGDFNLHEARIEGQIIQFFEQAFDWHNMTWLLYPYFWASPRNQHQKMLAENEDPEMREFLAAGAARVVIPVPEAYETAVLHFFKTNEIWTGGEPPLLNDPEYISIAEELKRGRTDSFNTPIHYEGAGTPPPFIIDEWEVKLPTSLVMLQDNDDLPVFQTGLSETNAAALLDAKAAATGTGSTWRNSVVALLTLYGVQRVDEAGRRTFATQAGYPGDAANAPISSVDQWSYFHVLNAIEANGLS